MQPSTHPIPAPDRLAKVMALELSEGAHADIDLGLCVMEAVAFVAGEKWSDNPQCACPVIGAFLRSWNDTLPDEDRTRLLRPLLPRLVGTRSTPEIEQRRAMMATDWLIRSYTPAWLRLAGLTTQADALVTLPEITGMAQIQSIRPAIEAARQSADAARAAAWDAARAAAWDAARAAAGDAARAAAGAAARAAAWDAARAAAWAAAWAAAGAALKPTVIELQTSALALVERMIEAAP